MKIFLIGYMASGKSVVAEKLSQLLGFRFVDTDKWIEARCCKSIPEIFSDHGEIFFREKEKECIEFLMDHQDIVVSTGGGIILKNRDLLNQTFNIYLKCDLETLIKRTSRNKNRPLLKNNVEKNIKILFNDRKEIYNETSDFTINANSNTQKTIKTILEHLNQ